MLLFINPPESIDSTASSQLNTLELGLDHLQAKSTWILSSCVVVFSLFFFSFSQDVGRLERTLCFQTPEQTGARLVCAQFGGEKIQMLSNFRSGLLPPRPLSPFFN